VTAPDQLHRSDRSTAGGSNTERYRGKRQMLASKTDREGYQFQDVFPDHASVLPAQSASENTPDNETARAAPDERILLLEDREEVLLILSKTLRSVGDHLVTAESGHEGYGRFQEDGAFDLVITAIVMPGDLQGPAMAQQIRALKPATGFISLSGYASETTFNGNAL
jgi:CheY-like chemotaxis protein